REPCGPSTLSRHDALPTSYAEPLPPATLAFAEGLLKSYDADRERLDAELAESITGWTFTQMSQTDLNVLRLAVTEMRYGDDAPEDRKSTRLNSSHVKISYA